MWCMNYAGTCGRERLHGDKEAEWDSELKILVIGGPSVGKTAFCKKFFQEKYLDTPDKTPIAVSSESFCEKVEEVDGEVAILRIIDLSTEFPARAPQNCMSGNLKKMILASEGFVLVYSVTDRRSLIIVQQLVSYIQDTKRSTDLPLVLVGNKMDVWTERCISREEGRKIAFDLGIAFYESSTRLGVGHVSKIFHDVVRQIRCVRMRSDYERRELLPAKSSAEKNATSFGRNIINRLSFRTTSCKKKVERKMSQ